MFLRKLLANILVYLVLEIGALMGVPMSPEQIEKLMQVMTRTKVEQILHKEKDEE